MSFTSGFFNSLNGDRRYFASEISELFDGLITDGVYSTIGDSFMVKSTGGMNMTVGTGRAWFNHTWSLNDTLYPITAAPSDIVLPRIDAVVIEINKSDSVRSNSIKYITGAAETNPNKPVMVNTNTIKQIPLAYVRLEPLSESISQSNIENAVGTSACPFVTGVVTNMNIDDLVAQWGTQWNEFLLTNKELLNAAVQNAIEDVDRVTVQCSEQVESFINTNTSIFDQWFKKLNTQLSGDIAGNLQKQINNSWSLSDGTRIVKNTDLNILVNPGNYYNELNEDIPTLKNCPVDRSFTLKVSLTNGKYDGAITQELNAHNNEMSYFRKGYKGGDSWKFGPWEQLASSRNSWTLKGGNKILDNTDLNNITIVGNYYCETTKTVQTLKNVPQTSFAFTLKVFEPNGNKYLLGQELITTMGEVFYRCLQNQDNVWKFDAWTKTPTIKDLNSVKTIANNAMPKSGGQFTAPVMAAHSDGWAYNIKNADVRTANNTNPNIKVVGISYWLK